ncbi:hypothetical protein [Streptomyces sp. NL15-2K]|uniref:hypothetical protein n=1 Tax=Streptomyces sp. NL15-2K TaxID=376149 RepID=UPI000F55D311|nr:MULTISPECIES: hypothetical protein [Actinomycetes]WKX06143.1 hypothetical protein Q4V64_01030 [Kutzneria buriramensis]GCB42836.1 hypothetical protein SNL152K_119 [Streptomyces sp. NL15-2K]
MREDGDGRITVRCTVTDGNRTSTNEVMPLAALSDRQLLKDNAFAARKIEDNLALLKRETHRSLPRPGRLRTARATPRGAGR